MELNADFEKRALVHAAEEPWVASPMKGVERRMLDRIGGEVARATSIVRYAEGSHFSPHVHHGGEEFLVLDGVFQDEHGDYPAGCYVRNPPRSRHTPGAAAGCLLFVKLWQFDPQDPTFVRLDSAKMPRLPAPGRPGVELVPLFKDDREEVRLEHWAPGARIDLDLPGGLELLLLEGGLTWSGETLKPHSWARLPKGDRLVAEAGPKGAKLWVKEGHLSQKPQAPNPD